MTSPFRGLTTPLYYVAEAFLLGEGLAFSKHSAVIAAFGRCFAKSGRVPAEYHRFLIEGQSSQNIGDYDVRARLTDKEAAEQISRAEKFLKLARDVLGAIPRGQTPRRHGGNTRR